MIRELLCPGLLKTGPVLDHLWVVRRGLMNFFVVEAPGGFVCFDAGWGVRRTSQALALLGVDAKKVVAVFLTHMHWDHAGGVGAYPHAAFYVGDHEKPALITGRLPASACMRVGDGQLVEVAGLPVRAIHTPGHTCGSVSYVAGNGLLFSGDTIRLWQGTAMPFAPWCSQDRSALFRSISKLAQLKGVAHILTAHSGVTTNVDRAFRRWRGTPDRGQESQSER
jgi:glyoxylase-like metal-dependent hydrolase (beta-lactamase superfamily II)